MQLTALALDTLQVRYHTAIQDLAHRYVRQRGLHASSQPSQRLRARSAASLLDRPQRSLHVLYREPQGVRKLRIQQKELEDPLRRQIRRVHLAIRLKRRGAAQQPHPLQVLISHRPTIALRPEIAVIRIQQRRGRHRTLEISPHLDEVPAFAMRHRRVRHALKLMHCLQHLLQKGRRRFARGLRRRLHHRLYLRPRHVQVQRVQPVPLLCRNLLAHIPCTLSRRNNARQHRRLMSLIEGQCACQLIRISIPLHALRPPQRTQHAHPPVVRARRALIQHQVQVHVHQPRRMLCALQVPRHPVQRIRYTREHGAVLQLRRPTATPAALEYFVYSTLHPIGVPENYTSYWRGSPFISSTNIL